MLNLILNKCYSFNIEKLKISFHVKNIFGCFLKKLIYSLFQKLFFCIILKEIALKLTLKSYSKFRKIVCGKNKNNK